jgi:hypothetical protein
MCNRKENGRGTRTPCTHATHTDTSSSLLVAIFPYNVRFTQPNPLYFSALRRMAYKQGLHLKNEVKIILRKTKMKTGLQLHLFQPLFALNIGF